MNPSDRSASVRIRPTRPEDFGQLVPMCLRVYPDVPEWTEGELAQHLAVFPEGQLVAEDGPTGQLLGMASSLIVNWEQYAVHGRWEDFTGGGTFRNHDPVHGRTLYGAELMVDPAARGRGVGKRIYQARFDLCRRLGLLRIRAGARLPGYGQHVGQMSAEAYVRRVVRGELGDPTLSFQLKQGFRVMAVVQGYLREDTQSRGCAAIIEWINHRIARRRDYAGRDRRFSRRRKSAPPPEATPATPKQDPLREDDPGDPSAVRAG